MTRHKVFGKQRFISLNVKMIATVFLSVLLAAGVYFACSQARDKIIKEVFLSDKAIAKNAEAAYESLESYIAKNNTKATDSTALSQWLKTREYTYILVYDNYENVFEAGWWVESDGYMGFPLEKEEVDSEAATKENRIDESRFRADASNRIIEFADGKYYVYMNYYGEQQWYDFMNIVTIVLCFDVILITLLIYNGQNIKRIKELSTAVDMVSSGNLSAEIKPVGADELGLLATGVNDMKDSVIEKLEREKAAWAANAELITSMSHDIRTPLTSMIGYLDIIEGKKYADEEELKTYVESCRSKAFQLKDLSDKLFQYFLVFGSPETKRDIERLDGEILFQQMLVEHVAEINSYGYNVNLDYTIEQCFVNIDVSMMRRLFDNLFSNIMKYADKKEPISIRGYNNNANVEIVFDNIVLAQSKKVESTNIGVKTCEKICLDLGGDFQVLEMHNHYVSKIIIPIAE